jgi:hypothetical protein
LIASTREDALFRDGGTNLIRDGRPRGIFSEPRVHLQQELTMKSTSNDLTNPGEDREKPSRAAEYIAALYVALVLMTPWLLRDAPLFAPSKGVEIQMSNRSAPPPTVELKARATQPGDARPVSAN